MPVGDPQPDGGERRLGRDIVATGLTQVAVAGGGLLLYRLLALEKGADGVASYALVKQVVIFAWPVVMVGLQTAVPRYVALGRDRARVAEAYLLAAVGLTGLATAVLSALALASPSTTASLVFGDSERTNLVGPFVATLLATTLFEVTYGYFRGRAEFGRGNAVRILGVATFPVVLLLTLPGEPIGTLIYLMALGTLVPCAIVVAPPLVRGIRGWAAARSVRPARTLLNYGYRRIGGEVGAVVLFTVPVVLAAHLTSLREVAYLSAGMYVLGVVSIAFQPIGLVFLPLLSRLCATDFERARAYVARLATCALHIAIFVTPQLLLFTDVATRAWLGPDFEDAGPIIRITALGAAFYILHLILRNALDAAAVTAYNARNHLVALAAATIAVSVSLAVPLGPALECIAWSFTLGMLFLGGLTLVTVQWLFRLGWQGYSLGLAVALAVVGAGIGWLVHLTLVDADPSLLSVLAILGIELCLTALYLAALARAGVTWPGEIARRLWRRS